MQETDEVLASAEGKLSFATQLVLVNVKIETVISDINNVIKIDDEALQC